jgi:phospholipid/cholesterol/gamma-HCH transport system substrate-binding protein
METRANYVLVGSCVLGAIVAIAIFIFWLGASKLSHQEDIYYTYFNGSVAGLSPGSPVRYRGVPVGTVGDIVIDRDNIELIRVTLKLNAGTPVKTDTAASLEMAGITGGSYVELSGGTQASPPLKQEDDNIPVIKAESSSLQSLVADAPKLLGKLSAVADSANNALSPDNVKNLDEILANVKTLTASLNGMTPELQSAVGSINRLVADLQTQIPRLLTSVQQDATSIKGAADQFGRVATDADGLIEENRGPLREFTGSTLPQLRTLTETLNRTLDKIDADPQRFLFGGGANVGIDPNRPIGADISTGASR